MKVLEGCDASTGDFWYDLAYGGYLKPSKILANKADIKKVEDAITTILLFEKSCEEQIDGFMH